jgi:hypothetical protein
MHDDKKTVAEWEEARAMLIDIPEGTEIVYPIEQPDGTMQQGKSEMDLSERLTSDQFFERFYAPANRPKVLSVHHGDRKAWLDTNGYNTSRDSMLDISLPSKAELESQAKADEAKFIEESK